MEMDKAAKSHMSIARQRPRHYIIKYEPWSLCYNSHKVVKNISSTLHGIVHSKEARSYWEDKEKLEEPCLDFVNWDAIGSPMKSTQLLKILT